MLRFGIRFISASSSLSHSWKIQYTQRISIPTCSINTGKLVGLGSKTIFWSRKTGFRILPLLSRMLMKWRRSFAIHDVDIMLDEPTITTNQNKNAEGRYRYRSRHRSGSTGKCQSCFLPSSFLHSLQSFNFSKGPTSRIICILEAQNRVRNTRSWLLQRASLLHRRLLHSRRLS